MKTARPYRMQARAAATEATRERILGAARTAFLNEWYDEVTLSAIARSAGVSQQTVINHFGGKEGLLMAVVDRADTEIAEVRSAASPGDVDGAIRALVADYEQTGDGVIRALALEGRVDALAPVLARGRANHRAWVERMLGDGGRVALLVVATDVYTWKLLRRDQGLSREATVGAMCALVRGVLASPVTTKERSR
jgi:AcrR family transcriptional regulator